MCKGWEIVQFRKSDIPTGCSFMLERGGGGTAINKGRCTKTINTFGQDWC